MKAQALDWLLERSNPAVRMLTLTDILRRPLRDADVAASRQEVLKWRPVVALERAQGDRGYWPPEKTSYTPKFTSTVWQLMLLGELGVPRNRWVESAVERFLGQHQMESGAFCCGVVGGRGTLEEEPCLTGNMIRTLLVFGFGDDIRVRKAIGWLPEVQFDDGGWNCDFPRHRPTHGSFMSTVEPLWAYSELPRSRWTRRIKSSAERGAEFLLFHRVYKSHRSWEPVELRGLGRVMKGNLVTKFHFPMYYYYDALHGLRVLSKLGYQGDERMEDAVHLMLSKVTPEGKWLLEGDWVRERSDSGRKTLVTFERLNEPSKWVTLSCYRVLAVRGDLELPA